MLDSLSLLPRAITSHRDPGPQAQIVVLSGKFADLTRKIPVGRQVGKNVHNPAGALAEEGGPAVPAARPRAVSARDQRAGRAA
jgi:hypothetical protein